MMKKKRIKTFELPVIFKTNLLEKMSDKHRVPETELSDSEDEGDNRRDNQSFEKDDDPNQIAEVVATPAADQSGSVNNTLEPFETVSTQSTVDAANAADADGMDTTE
jgi:hypothetical protein